MKIDTFRRIIIEDYPPEHRDIAEKLGYSLNSYTDEVSQALDKRLTISENINWTRVTIAVTVDSNGTPTSPTRVRTDLTTPCGGTQVIKSVNNTLASGYPTGTPFISFTEQAGILTIDNVTNLLANNKYTLTVILYPIN